MSQPTMPNEIHFTLALPNQRRSMQSKAALYAHPLAPPLPRIARLMALAIRFEALLRELDGLSHAHLAQLGGVSPSHITHILNLLHLAPDIQERLLFLEPGATGPDRIKEANIRPVTHLDDWEEQRRLLQTILALSVSA